MATQEDDRQQAGGDGPETAPRRGRVIAALRWLRPETVLLLVALLWTVGAKIVVVRQQRPESFLLGALEAIGPDLVFFLAVGALFALLFAPGRDALAARLVLVVSAVILAWSIMNAAWLVATGVQLQLGMLRILIGDPEAIVPMVANHLEHNKLLAAPLILTLLAGVTWIGWRFVRPRRAVREWRVHVRRAAIAASVLVVVGAGVWLGRRQGVVAYSGEVLGFSSHWHGIVQLVSDAVHPDDVAHVSRALPRVGERRLVPPEPSADGPSNVVIVLLESVAHQATSFAQPSPDTTPELARIAAEGAAFESTRVPVPQTSKAFWATLTGATPDTDPDFVEAVLVDRPYEGLASILGGAGYRSAFFQMSQGSFQCAPGLFANLGFDWAWFRENLEDESAHLGYMNGDDFRMLDPMFDWVDAREQPFLLVMITSVSHDPYLLPDWYDHQPTDDRHARYLDSIRFTDRFVGDVRRRLEERGVLDDTILCVLGDHGEGFRAETKRGRWAPFEDVIRVPWAIRYPRKIDAGTRVDGPASQLDVTPTILRLLGWGIDDAAFDGVDALAGLDPERRLYFSCWHEDSPIGYLEGDRKYVYWPRRETLFRYDLDADPGETTAVSVTGGEKHGVMGDLAAWYRRNRFDVPARRFRERLLYDHWRAFSDGRYARAYYVSDDDR
ncbi:MAG: LTA synthase family protein [Planctomycetota bacterium]|jgi:arylsulfatase A-like enzyme